MSHLKRILLGQLGRRGDCLYATAVARQIKHDYPGCHLTWAISSMCRSVIEGNPYVDEIWEIKQHTNNDVFTVWNQFEAEAARRKSNGEYDEIFLTQVHPGNFQNYDGTSRSSIFRGYPLPITVPITPVVRLSSNEINNVALFISKCEISTDDAVIIFECVSTSGQSFVTQDYAQKAAELVLKKVDNIKFILTSDQKLNTNSPHIFDGSGLTFKENAELTKYCHLLVGCSSGISWLATSDWAKQLPHIQLLNKNTNMYASMIHDANYFGLSTDMILEMQSCTPKHLADCIVLHLREGFARSKNVYHVDIPIKYNFYFSQLYWELISKGEILKASQALHSALERYFYDDESIKELNLIIRDILYHYIDIVSDESLKLHADELYDLIGYKVNGSQNNFFLISYLNLIFKSIVGNNKIIARTLLKDVIVKYL